MNPTESWRPVPGWEGVYDISDQGRVKRVAAEPRVYYGLILAQRVNRGGYPVTNLDSGKRTVEVHRLVALAFLGHPPAADSVVNHKDGNKANNRVENLEWTTPLGNYRHAVEMGLCPPLGARNRILTTEQVKEIRRLRGQESTRSLARRFGTCQSNVAMIQTCRNWKELPA